MTTELIVSIGGAAVLVIGALAAGMVKIIQALKEIHLLVNSRLEAALKELARVSEALAKQTGQREDEENAMIAKRASMEKNRQAEAIAEAKRNQQL